MKVKQIEACDVIRHLEDGKEVCCIDFGDARTMGAAGIHVLDRYPIKQVIEATKNPDNLFFEEVKDKQGKTALKGGM